MFFKTFVKCLYSSDSFSSLSFVLWSLLPVVVHLFFVWFSVFIFFFSLIDLLCVNCSSFFLVDLPSSRSLYCPLSSFFIYYYYYYYYYYSDQQHLVTLSFLCIRPSSISKRRRTRQKTYRYVWKWKENKFELIFLVYRIIRLNE